METILEFVLAPAHPLTALARAQVGTGLGLRHPRRLLGACSSRGPGVGGSALGPTRPPSHHSSLCPLPAVSALLGSH